MASHFTIYQRIKISYLYKISNVIYNISNIQSHNEKPA